MHYNELFKAADSFDGDYYAYDYAWKVTANLNFKESNTFPYDLVKNGILGFLDKWKCRIPYSDYLAKMINDTYRGLISFFEILEGASIEDLSLERVVVGDNKETNVRFVLFTVFDRFSNIEGKFRHR